MCVCLCIYICYIYVNIQRLKWFRITGGGGILLFQNIVRTLFSSFLKPLLKFFSNICLQFQLMYTTTPCAVIKTGEAII